MAHAYPSVETRNGPLFISWGYASNDQSCKRRDLLPSGHLCCFALRRPDFFFAPAGF